MRTFSRPSGSGRRGWNWTSWSCGSRAGRNAPVEVLAVVEAKRNINDLGHGFLRRQIDLAWLTGDRAAYDPAEHRTGVFDAGHFDRPAAHWQDGRAFVFAPGSFSRFARDDSGHFRDGLWLVTRAGPVWGLSGAALGGWPPPCPPTRAGTPMMKRVWPACSPGAGRWRAPSRRRTWFTSTPPTRPGRGSSSCWKMRICCQGCHILAALRTSRKSLLDKRFTGLSFLRLPNWRVRARARSGVRSRFRLASGWPGTFPPSPHHPPARESEMKRPLALAFTAAVVGVCALTAMSQPPEGRGPGGKKGGPPGFELGRVLPPFVRDDLDLTADQERQLAALEAEVRQKLEKILTVEQRKRAAGARRLSGRRRSARTGPRPGASGRRRARTARRRRRTTANRPGPGASSGSPPGRPARPRPSGPGGQSCSSRPPRTAPACPASGDRASNRWTGVSCPGPT